MFLSRYGLRTAGIALVGSFCMAQVSARPLSLGETPLASLAAECKDLKATCYVSKLVPAELEKIGKDFSATYRLRNLTLYFQSPDKIRLEATSRVLGDALLILNGAERFYTLSKLNIRKRENLDKEPAKRQSLLEYAGLLSAGTFDFMSGAFVESTMLNGSLMRVYDLKYKGEAKSFYRIWVNPQTRLVAKRVWMESDGKAKATFLYINPKEIVPGVWLPSQCEIQNGDGILAAVIDFREATINKGLDAALFEIKS